MTATAIGISGSCKNATDVISPSGWLTYGVKEASMAASPELWDALLPVVDALAALDVSYCIGGSVASSFAGVARATLDGMTSRGSYGYRPTVLILSTCGDGPTPLGFSTFCIGHSKTPALSEGKNQLRNHHPISQHN
jgi:hypothetical protein